MQDAKLALLDRNSSSFQKEEGGIPQALRTGSSEDNPKRKSARLREFSKYPDKIFRQSQSADKDAQVRGLNFLRSSFDSWKFALCAADPVGNRGRRRESVESSEDQIVISSGVCLVDRDEQGSDEQTIFLAQHQRSLIFLFVETRTLESEERQSTRHKSSETRVNELDNVYMCKT